MGCQDVLFQANKPDIDHHDRETISLGSTLTQMNSRTHMLTDTLPHEKPDIYADKKNFLVYPTEVFLVKKKNGINVSVYWATHTKFLVSALVCCRLTPARRSITPRSSPRLARRPSRRNLLPASSSRSPSTLIPPQRETPPPLPDPQHQHSRWCGGSLIVCLHRAV